MSNLRVDPHGEDRLRRCDTLRNDHRGDLLRVQLHGRVGFEHSSVASSRPVGQRQLDAELEPTRILGPRALHDRRPGLALRLKEPRAIAREHLDQHRQSRVQRLPEIARALDRPVDGIQALEEPHIPYVLVLHRWRVGARFPTGEAPRRRPAGRSVIDPLPTSIASRRRFERGRSRAFDCLPARVASPEVLIDLPATADGEHALSDDQIGGHCEVDENPIILGAGAWKKPTC